MALVTDMGIPLGGTGGILQPLHKNRWQIEMLFPTGGGNIKAVTSMAITAERPNVEYEEIQLDRYNSRAFIQGKYTFQPINIVIEPDFGGKCHRAIRDQMEKQQLLIGPNSGPFLGQAEAGEDYKFTTIMQLLNGHHPDGGANLLEQWMLEGCALHTVNFGDLDYQASETIKTTMTVRYDHARVFVTGTEKKATKGFAR